MLSFVVAQTGISRSSMINGELLLFVITHLVCVLTLACAASTSFCDLYVCMLAARARPWICLKKTIVRGRYVVFVVCDRY